MLPFLSILRRPRRAVPNKKPRRTRLTLESLEERRLLSGAGMLDPTFGSGGVQIIGNHPLRFPFAHQPDGKLLTVQAFDDEEVVRYNADGSLDTSLDRKSVV